VGEEVGCLVGDFVGDFVGFAVGVNCSLLSGHWSPKVMEVEVPKENCSGLTLICEPLYEMANEPKP
jgi:hypothetical protein